MSFPLEKYFKKPDAPIWKFFLEKFSGKPDKVNMRNTAMVSAFSENLFSGF